MNAGNSTSNNLNASPSKRRSKTQANGVSDSLYDQSQRDPSFTNATLTNRTTSSKPKSTNNTVNGVSGENLRDTSVNVASAFTQAVQSFAMSGNPTTNGYTTATRNGVYDSSSRGLGAPPPSRARKPASSRRGRAGEESDEDVDTARLRGKSPLLEAASSFVRALSPGGSLYLRQRANGAEEDGSYPSLTGAFAGINHMSSQGSTRLNPTQSQTSHGNVSSDYNYSREESLVKKMDPPAKPASAMGGLKKRAPRQSGAISLDKQAYKPPVDEEEDEDEWSEDEKGHRRRRIKGPSQKKLNNLPVVGAQAKQRRKKRKGKDGQEEDGSESETPARESVVRSVRGSVPPIVATSWQDSYDATVDGPTSYDQPEEHFADEYAIDESQAHPSESSFSIGGMMGRLVNLSVRAFASILTFAIGSASTVVLFLVRIIVSLFDLILIQPASFVSDRANKIFGSFDWSLLWKGIVLVMMTWLFFTSLYAPGQSTSGGPSWIPWRQTRPPPIDYSAPGASSAALADMARRLQEMENKVIDMQFSQRRAFDRLDTLSHMSNEHNHKLDTMGDNLGKQQKARIDAEKDLRASSSAAMSGLRTELSNMIASISQVDTGVFDGRIKGLESRLIAAESGVKDAIDTSKQAITVANSKGSAVSTGGRWWGSNSDGKSLTIKSTDGQDVTGLISNLVELAVQRWGKDDIAKADYAGYFSGARVIPQLTTQTYKIEDRSFWGRWGVFGSTATEGRPPVTALHPDIHVGNCWPFKGSSGQIGVMLSRSIIISEVTIDHAAKEVAFDVRSAPKKMELWGLVDGAENVRKVAEYHRRREQRYRDLVNAANREGRTPPPPEDPYPSTLPPDAHYLRLAQFSYDVNAPSHIQTFSVPQEIQDLGVDIGIVVLMVRSNWGEPNWTCLYRLRVHGRDPDQRPHPQGEIDE
ncbi:hypothetical protein CPB86DRAFT_778529 [Serendipita vermifera]|nr:hypothetical protein CPB86DRAFT_778529 [Serendipita vermifera]